MPSIFPPSFGRRTNSRKERRGGPFLLSLLAPAIPLLSPPSPKRKPVSIKMDCLQGGGERGRERRATYNCTFYEGRRRKGSFLRLEKMAKGERSLSSSSLTPPLAVFTEIASPVIHFAPQLVSSSSLCSSKYRVSVPQTDRTVQKFLLRKAGGGGGGGRGDNCGGGRRGAGGRRRARTSQVYLSRLPSLCMHAYPRVPRMS